MSDSSVSVDLSVVDSGEVIDSNVNEDAAVDPDMSVVLPDMSVLDAATPQDMAIVMEDAAVEPDQGAPPGACADLNGARCDGPNMGCCENRQPVLVCRGGAFVVEDNGFPCDCVNAADGVSEVECAVPGFVGIHRATVYRRRAPRLRGLIS